MDFQLCEMAAENASLPSLPPRRARPSRFLKTQYGESMHECALGYSFRAGKSIVPASYRAAGETARRMRQGRESSGVTDSGLPFRSTSCLMTATTSE